MGEPKAKPCQGPRLPRLFSVPALLSIDQRTGKNSTLECAFIARAGHGELSPCVAGRSHWQRRVVEKFAGNTVGQRANVGSMNPAQLAVVADDPLDVAPRATLNSIAIPRNIGGTRPQHSPRREPILQTPPTRDADAIGNAGSLPSSLSSSLSRSPTVLSFVRSVSRVACSGSPPAVSHQIKQVLDLAVG